MPTSAEPKTDLVDVTLNTLMREDLPSIDEQLRFGVNLDAMVSQPLHHFFDLRAFRVVASVIERGSLGVEGIRLRLIC